MYIDFDHHEGRVPNVLTENDLVEEFSLFSDFERLSYRERGLYKYQSASAELEVVSFGARDKEYRAHIKAKNMDDLLDLLRMIKEGSIPPSQSYDGQQVKKGDETINLIPELQGFSKSLKETRGTSFSSKKETARRVDELIARLKSSVKSSE